MQAIFYITSNVFTAMFASLPEVLGVAKEVSVLERCPFQKVLRKDFRIHELLLNCGSNTNVVLTIGHS
jgi:hypothetical protein